MGCRKLSYYQEGEGLENCSVFFGKTLEKKGGQQIFCLNYYPFGGTFNSYTSGTENLYKYNGKEEQKETRWYDYGARMYMPDIGRWGVVDKKSDDIMQIDKSPYQYAWDNPVNLTDPDGNCPWCLGAVVGGLVEYGTQVAVNLAQGQSLSEAAYDNVDFVDVAVATVEGGITAGASVAKNLVKKAVIVGASEIVKAAVDGTAAEGVTVETDVSKVATDAAIETAFAVGGSEGGKALVNASSDAAVKSAKSGVTAANKNLNKAVKAVQNGDVRSNATTPKIATDNLTSAKTNLATAKTLNGTLGANKATQETTKAAVDGTASLSGVGATDIKDELVD